MWSDKGHGFRIGVLTAVATLIAWPLVVFVLGPAMPPGNWTDAAKGQVFDNTVLLAVLTPFTMFILVYLGYAIRVFRAEDTTGGQLKDGPPIRGHMPSQVAWLVVTTIAVLFLAIFGSAEILASGSGGGQGPKPIARPGGHPLQVQVIGQQWEFTYRYPSFGGVETAQLVLPVDTQIEFHVTSIDAIHSFWAYQLGVKADANPGVDNIAFVKPNRVGSFQVRCAELCGLWHGYMFDTGKVVTADQFATWIKSQQKAFAPVQKFLPPYSTTYEPDPQDRAG